MMGAIFFALGLVLGSFINAVLWRLPKRKKIIFDRSECVHCGHKLEWRDLFPVLSFIFLKGRCRYCNKKISAQYPIVELAAGFGIFAVSKYGFGFLENIWLSGIFALSILIFIYDYRHFLILDRFIIFGTAWILAGLAFFQSSNLLENFLTAAAIFLFFFSFYFFSNGRWMGGGDPKLGFVIGLWLGWPMGVLSIFISVMMGSALGIFLILIGRAKMKSKIPFGSLMTLGAWIAYFYGNRILEWYTSLFL